MKRALARYPLHVVRMDVDPETNPFGMAWDCYSGPPQRIEGNVETPVPQSKESSNDRPSLVLMFAADDSCGWLCGSRFSGRDSSLGRLPLAIPLRINQERIVFVDQNVRVGIPRSLTEKLRIQSTGGAIYLLAKEAIEPTRLQLQNAKTGEIILVDIAATEAPTDQPALEPMKIVEGETSAARYGGGLQHALPNPLQRVLRRPAALTTRRMSQRKWSSEKRLSQ